MNNNEIINQIKDSLDITDIIGERVKLRKTSRGYMGLCPFHQEDTPSFHVYSDTQTYYCFGCHVSGDIFTYVMKSENLSFPEALTMLADRANIKLDAHHHEDIDTRSILELAGKFFTSNLMNEHGRAARAYMSRRNLNAEDITRYSLGYSLNAWDSLTKFLRSRGITDNAILDSGLALTNSQGLYDRFRGRLMFPIRDITGKIIAFGGRLLDGEGAKYINSPEGIIYSKRRNLYMMNDARKSIREKGRSILVEGYMDALRLHKCGFTESVASLGTSLTPEQAEILSRYADRCYICYDSDSAGQEAALKGMYTLAEHGLNVYFVNIPEGKDPDEFLSNNSPEKFETALSEARPLVLKHIDLAKTSLLNERTRRSALNALFENFRRLNLDDVLQYMGSICAATMLSPEAVEHYLLNNGPENLQVITPKKYVPANKPEIKPYDEAEAVMCALLFKNAQCRVSLNASEVLSIFANEPARETALALITEEPETIRNLWLLLEDGEKISLLSFGENIRARSPEISDAEIFISAYKFLKLRSIKKLIAELNSMPLDEKGLQELVRLYKQRELYSR